MAGSQPSYASGAVLAPFSYVMLIWTVLIDLIWFGNWPRSTTWIGSAIIVATGLYVWYRERTRSREAGKGEILTPHHRL